MPPTRVAPSWRFVLGAGLLLVPAACRSAEERARSAEAATMSSAIQRLRAAPHDEKQAPLAALQAVACHHARACEAQQVCAQAYALHTKALETGAEVRERMGRGATPSDAAAELLARAEKDLEASKRMMDQCLEVETSMLVEARP